MPRPSLLLRTALILALLPALAAAQPSGPQGYYRQPTLHGDTLIFVAEGDLWRVAASGGQANRITSHPGDEANPEISPDGQTVAFTAQYEGPTEVYTMPIAGGLPTRRTFDASRAAVQGWTPDGRIIATTDKFSTLPNTQTYLLDPKTGQRSLLPLAQASDACIDALADRNVVYFTRLSFNGSYTKRYKGGTAQTLWSYDLAAPDKEAQPVPALGYEGATKRPMVYRTPAGGRERLFYLTDSDGTMNIWSMPLGLARGGPWDGPGPVEHTHHKGFDVGGGGGNAGADLDASTGRIAYQLGPDIHVYDIAADKDSTIPITLESDFDQERERWVKKPIDYVTAAHLSPDGEHLVLTARGHIFVFPQKQGRIVEAGKEQGVRYRAARFLPALKDAGGGRGGGENDAAKPRLIALSDQSGEVELWTLPANGIGDHQQLTTDADSLRWEAIPSPDGRLIAHNDKNLHLFIYDTQSKKNTKIDDFKIDDSVEYTWSPDSRYLAYVYFADNTFKQIKIWDSTTNQGTLVTTDRFDSYAPAWSADGNWLYFLSDRNLKTVVDSPWGANQPDPFLDKTTKIYALALHPGQRSPFAPKDELHADDKKKDDKPAEKDEKKPTEPAPKSSAAQPDKDTYKPTAKQPAESSAKPDTKPDSKPADKKPAPIDFTGIAARLFDVPAPPGNYSHLLATEKALFYTTADRESRDKLTLTALPITNDSPDPKTVLPDIKDAELSGDAKHFLIHKGDSFYIIDASPAPVSELDKKQVDLSGWSLSITPREEWRQMFTEAWRLERDYFYDTAMHGVDWKKVRDKYAPLVDRVSTRAELSDILAQMIGELSALHMFVRGGDLRQGDDQVQVAALGALLSRDEQHGGFRIDKIFQTDPDDPQLTAPLARPDVAASVGDIITMINGTPALSVPDPAQLLRNKAGKQVLIHLKPSQAQQAGGGEPAANQTERDAIVVPISQGAESDLRYHDWEYSRRQLVEKWSGGQIGYVHLRAMGGDNFTEFVRGFYPVYTRAGLIIDVRHNRGGNIDSWILSKLSRKAWFFWNQRVGGQPPTWNMQYAFRGHMVCLCNERTASDGEAFSEGFKRLGLGKVMGTRTWGGEIWLSSSNVLVDKGIATAAETGVYGPEGTWLVEGRGVEPDITVDNLPHATFTGEDAQLKAAVDHLLQLIKDKPIPPPVTPRLPNKAFDDNK